MVMKPLFIKSILFTFKKERKFFTPENNGYAYNYFFHSNLKDTMTDINKVLTSDLIKTYKYMTLFYCTESDFY